MARERWGSKLGVILAVAGSAVGLGNFLRFPAKVADNGGGAFMIPYFVALLLLGIPLMWIEWTIGRFGGGFGHSTAPGIFHTMWNKNRFIKYFGVIGIFGPIAIYIYYVYVESWLLGYSWFAITGRLAAVPGDQFSRFLGEYQGVVSGEKRYFPGIGTAYLFFLVTFLTNLLVVRIGLRRGIEVVCKYGLAILFIMAMVLVVRVLTLGPQRTAVQTAPATQPVAAAGVAAVETAPAGQPEMHSPIDGLGYMWNPQWSMLGGVRPVNLGFARPRLWVPNSKVWLEAAGQIFFTLSVGIGVILTYASYLRKRDDVALSGLTAAATNEFAEVILGGSILIPAAFVFLGAAGLSNALEGGMFNLGFVTMPMVFNHMPWSGFLAFCWFGLLFLAGVTSSISLAQPAISFLEDEFNLSKRKAVAIFGLVTFVLCQAVVFYWHRGVLDELDVWGTTFALTLFATIEVILFAWVFGMNKAWTELHVGSDIRIPGIYRFVIKYITPVFLLLMLGFWLAQVGIPTLLLVNFDVKNKADLPYIMATRYGMLVLLVVLVMLVNHSWQRRRAHGTELLPTDAGGEP